MTPPNKKVYLSPQDVEPAEAIRVLAFLNTAQTAKEIVDAIKLAGGGDVGIRVAQNILNRRAQLGSFTDLKQVTSVAQVSARRFTKIIEGLGKQIGRSRYIMG